MPLYDFICRTCGKEFETLVMGSDRPRCPQCDSEDLAKQMSTFAHRSSGRSAGGGGSGTEGSGGGGCAGCTSSNCSSC